MTMAEMIFSENRLCNRNMLNMNLHHSDNEQNVLKKSEWHLLCTISLIDKKNDKAFITNVVLIIP